MSGKKKMTREYAMNNLRREAEERTRKVNDARKYRWQKNVIGITLLVICSLIEIFGNPMIYVNNGKLKKALTALPEGTVTLEEVVPFEWDTVFTFDPYTPIEVIENATGSESHALKESVSEGMTHVVFTHGGVTASVCAYPEALGYSLSFIGGEENYYSYSDGGYCRIENGDQVEFTVTHEDGVVALFAEFGE